MDTSKSTHSFFLDQNASARDLDLSVVASPHGITSMCYSKTFNDTTLRNILNDTTILGPGTTAYTRNEELTEVFYEVLQTSNTSDVLDTIGRFIQTCCDFLEKIKSWERFSPKNVWLAEEANTWRLMYCLYLESTQEKTGPAILTTNDTLSQKKVVGSLFQSDGDLRLMQLIVDWLENCASYQDSLTPPACGAGSTVHWENTLHHLENGMSLFNTDGNSTFVTQLDPDAPRRQKNTLHTLDQQDDNNLCRRIFKEIRCGRFEEAVSLCINAGQMWRGVILQGQRLLDYPEEPKHDSKFPLEGNSARDLWKLCCLRLLTDTDENSHFKATLGVLCGHLSSVLAQCGDSREDLLWAYLRVQIELRVDQHLREHHITALSNNSADNVQELLDQFEQPSEQSLNQIFGCVNALAKERQETCYQETQRNLILDQVDAMLQQVSVWICDADYNLIRFMAHLVLILRKIGKDPARDIGDNILKVYVEKLIEQIDNTSISPELIAHYTSTLPPSFQIEKYSQLMWLVEAKDDRRRVMDAGTQAGLDVEAAAIETVRYAIKLLREKNPSPGNESQELIQRVTSCLEWFSFYPTQIVEAVQMSNAIIRNLVFKGDVDSATGVLSRLTQFCPSGLISQQLNATSNALREHLCLKAYLEAINGYATWYRQHVGGRPRSPEPLQPNYSFTDKVHYEQIKSQANIQQERWKTAGLHQARHTKQLLYNVLLFPRGWLVDDIVSEDDQKVNDSEESFERERQLLSLRKLCIPEIILLLLKILQSCDIETQTEAIRLAEIVACERHQLYKLFSKRKLREVLLKIGDSSLAVLENNRDPWGFEPTIE